MKIVHVARSRLSSSLLPPDKHLTATCSKELQMRRIDGITYFTVEEASRLLGITVRTIQRWLSEPQSKPKHAPELTLYLFPDGKKYVRQEEIKRAYARALGTQLSDLA